MKERFIEQLKEICEDENVLVDEPMYKHITFKVGGNAQYYITPTNDEQIVKTIALCRENNIKFYVKGNGSNLLVMDKGYEGAIIEIGAKYSDIIIEENVITAKAGARLTQIAVKAMKAGLSGMEFAHGIPGTLGGAVTMNAGAYGGEMKDILTEVKVIDKEGKILTLDAEQLELGYRYSIIPKEEYIVLEAKLKLRNGDVDNIKAIMDDLACRRREKQPLEYPSAGSTFKRPEGYFAGKLIEDAGLKGYRCGGAMVSEKHCGFVINYDNATATDIINVINDVRDRINEIYGISLEPEVKIL